MARVAGIQAAKRASDLIPLCHPVLVGAVLVNFRIEDTFIEVEASVETVDRTGVEMEALTAVNVACLTIYDMCKSGRPVDGDLRRRPLGEDRRAFRRLPARRRGPPGRPRGDLDRVPGSERVRWRVRAACSGE
ncbi:MAG: cyclic pyranopterin monophosphate synthase MoaC [Microthrixaceae bacterium]